MDRQWRNWPSAPSHRDGQTNSSERTLAEKQRMRRMQQRATSPCASAPSHTVIQRSSKEEAVDLDQQKNDEENESLESSDEESSDQESSDEESSDQENVNNLLAALGFRKSALPKLREALRKTPDTRINQNLIRECAQLAYFAPEEAANLKRLFKQEQAQAAIDAACDAVAKRQSTKQKEEEEEEENPLDESEVTALFEMAVAEIKQAKADAQTEKKQLIVILGEHHSTDESALVSQLLVQIVSKLEKASLALELPPENVKDIVAQESVRKDVQKDAFTDTTARGFLHQRLLINEAVTLGMNVVGADPKKNEVRQEEQKMSESEAQKGLIKEKDSTGVDTRNDGIADAVSQLGGPVLLVVGAQHLGGLASHPKFKEHKLSLFDASGTDASTGAKGLIVKGDTSESSPFDLRRLARKANEKK